MESKAALRLDLGHGGKNSAEEWHARFTACRPITTEQAASVLGVSRSTIVRMVECGTLVARMVGAHRRLSLSEVLAHRAASSKRRSEALNDMDREAEELGLYD